MFPNKHLVNSPNSSAGGAFNKLVMIWLSIIKRNADCRPYLGYPCAAKNKPPRSSVNVSPVRTRNGTSHEDLLLPPWGWGALFAFPTCATGPRGKDQATGTCVAILRLGKVYAFHLIHSRARSINTYWRADRTAPEGCEFEAALSSWCGRSQNMGI